MSSIQVGEIRYYEWGDEKPGYVSTWTVNEKRAVIHLDDIPHSEAWEKKYIRECPYN